MNDTSLIKIVAYVKANYRMMMRYGISGISGVLANLAVFSVLVEGLGVWYMFAAVWGFIAAYIVTFLMHKFWTFTATGIERTLTQSLLYLMSALVILVINAALLYIQVEWFNLWPILAQFTALFISAALSFIFTSQVTFHQESNRLKKMISYIFKYLKKPWVIFLLLISVGVFFVSIRLMFIPVTFTGETVGYIATAEYMFNDGNIFLGERYLKPLAPIGVGLLSSWLGVSYDFAILIEAQLGYFALILAAYWFGFEFFRSRKKAVLTSLLVVTTYPILHYGLNPLTETGAWAMYFASFAAIMLWSRTLKTRWLWISCGLLFMGVLWKEYAVLAGLIFGLVILTHPVLSWQRKIHALLQGVFLIILPWAIWQWHVYSMYDYTYIEWLSISSANDAHKTEYNLRAVSKSLFAILTAGWLFVLLSWWKRHLLSLEARRFLLIMLVPSFGFLLWGWVSSRLFFSLVPLLVPLAVIGVSIFRQYRTQLLVVICIGILNLSLVWLAHVPNVRAYIDTFTYGQQE